jgi:enoyl-CoA hydratase/carnithine racemase
MSAREAKEYGIVDQIVGQTDATKAADRAEEAMAEPRANYGVNKQ